MYSCAKLIIIAGPRKENLSFLQRVVVTHVQVPEDVLYTPVLLGFENGGPFAFPFYLHHFLQHITVVASLTSKS